MSKPHLHQFHLSLTLALLANAAACGGLEEQGESSDEISVVGTTGFGPQPGAICDTTIQAHAQRHWYMGAPVQGTDQLLPDGGRYRDYNGGTILISPRVGCAYLVRYGFWERWKIEGRNWSVYGYPVSDEEWDGRGSFQFFEGGSMWWTASGGVRGLVGAIAVKHNEVRGIAGYPLTDPQPSFEFGQRVALEFGHVLYYSPRTGAHAVRNGILGTYLAMGEVSSTLGFPITDELCEPSHCWTDFQGGRLDWTPSAGVTVQRTIEDVSAWRLQLEVEVCNANDAGTDDHVFVELSSQPGRHYFLDSAADDFERSSVRRYDISPSKVGVSTVRDLQRITIGRMNFNQSGVISPSYAHDALCIRRVALYLNQVRATAGSNPIPIFNYTLPTQAWLSSPNQTVNITGATMRSQLNFSTARVPSVGGLVSSLAFDELEEMITGATGHILATRSGHFGDLHGRAVEVTMLSGDRVAVDLDLEGDTIDGPEVDVDFDIHFVCAGVNTLLFQIENQRVSVDPAWYQLFTQVLLFFVTPEFPTLTGPSIGTPFCPVVRVVEGSPGTVTFAPN